MIRRRTLAVRVRLRLEAGFGPDLVIDAMFPSHLDEMPPTRTLDSNIASKLTHCTPSSCPYPALPICPNNSAATFTDDSAAARSGTSFASL